MERKQVYEMIEKNKPKWKILSLEIAECMDDFTQSIMEKHGEPLSHDEVKSILSYLEPELYRLSKGYDGM
jgi:hypothetical protein